MRETSFFSFFCVVYLSCLLPLAFSEDVDCPGLNPCSIKNDTVLEDCKCSLLVHLDQCCHINLNVIASITWEADMSFSLVDGLACCSTYITVTGDFEVKSIASGGNFTGLRGPISVKTIGGDFSISNEYTGLNDWTSFVGLNYLEVISGSFSIEDSNIPLENTEGLSVLKMIGGDLDFGLLPSFSNFDAPSLQSIVGYAYFNDLKELTSFSVPSLESIGKYFTLSDLPKLETLPLQRLSSIGDYFELRSLDVLEEINLNNLSTVSGAFALYDLPSLALLSVPFLVEISGSFIISNVPINALFLDELQTVTSEFRLQNTDIDSLNMPSISSIHTLILKNNSKLIEFDSLSVLNINSVELDTLPELTSLKGLEGMQSCTGCITAKRLPKLDCNTLNTVVAAIDSSWIPLNSSEDCYSIPGACDPPNTCQIKADLMGCACTSLSNIRACCLIREAIPSITWVAEMSTDLTNALACCSTYKNITEDFDVKSVGATGNFLGLDGSTELIEIGGNFLSSNYEMSGTEAWRTFEGLENLELIGKNFLLDDGTIPIENTAGLTSLAFIGGNLNFLNLQYLTDMSFVELISVEGSLIAENMQALTQLAFPELIECEDLMIKFLPELGDVSMPKLSYIGGDLLLLDLHILSTVEFPKLHTVDGYISLQDLPSLSGIVALPKLTSISYNLYLAKLQGIVQFSAPLLTSIAELKIESSNIQHMTLSSLVTVNAIFFRDLPRLVHFDDLRHCSTITSVDLQNLPSLTSVAGLSGMSECSGCIIAQGLPKVDCSELNTLFSRIDSQWEALSKSSDCYTPGNNDNDDEDGTNIGAGAAVSIAGAICLLFGGVAYVFWRRRSQRSGYNDLKYRSTAETEGTSFQLHLVRESSDTGGLRTGEVGLLQLPNYGSMD